MRGSQKGKRVKGKPRNVKGAAYQRAEEAGLTGVAEGETAGLLPPSAPPRKYKIPTVALARRYAVRTVAEAKEIAVSWLESLRLDNALDFGLPEVDDRYHIWRVPLTHRGTGQRVGEAVIDARTSLLLTDKTTSPAVIEARLLGRQNGNQEIAEPTPTVLSDVRNTIVCGDCEKALLDLPAACAGLVFTSPPYYNARPEYEDYLSYDEYLLKMRRVIHNCHRVLADGRFFVINVSPVLVRRASRNESSRRLAVPFDLHHIFTGEGYDFIDDIIWEKPEGAGWATGRGRRFAADRHPLQYKPVPVTEYVLVYRKHTDKLIDWSIRNHHDQVAVRRSRIGDDYAVTNIWRIKPAHSPLHPAVFPLELAQKIVRYYSFEDDMVLDPFAGIGTTGKAAALLKRRFVLIEKEREYADIMIRETLNWLGPDARDVLCVNCEPPDTSELLAF